MGVVDDPPPREKKDKGSKKRQGRNNWPPSLKQVVAKWFGFFETEEEKSKVESILKKEITAAAANGELWTKRWDSQPVPSFLSDKKDSPLSSNIPKKSLEPRNNIGQIVVFRQLGRLASPKYSSGSEEIFEAISSDESSGVSGSEETTECSRPQRASRPLHCLANMSKCENE